jgi:hypothetical protein
MALNGPLECPPVGLLSDTKRTPCRRPPQTGHDPEQTLANPIRLYGKRMPGIVA